MTAKEIQLHIHGTLCGATIFVLAVHTIYFVIRVVVVFTGVVAIVIKKCHFGTYLIAGLITLTLHFCTRFKKKLILKSSNLARKIMLDFNTVIELSSTYCIGICAFLIPVSLLATSSTIILTFLNRPGIEIWQTATGQTHLNFSRSKTFGS